MAWVEQCGDNTWRVRYRRDDDTIGAIPGFTSSMAAREYANDMESDRRRGTWIDPAAGQTTLGEFVDNNDWLDSLDIDTRTLDNYRSMLRNHIRPAGATPRLRTSPTSKSKPGRNISAPSRWQRSASTAS